MAIFDKSNAVTPVSSETTIIASGAKIDGVFNCASRLHVDGEISGEINSKSIVTIGKGGTIKGNVTSSKLIVNGLFEGDAQCDSVEVLAGGKFMGKVLSKELMIEAKAHFEGESKIKRDDETPIIKKVEPKDK